MCKTSAAGKQPFTRSPGWSGAWLSICFLLMSENPINCRNSVLAASVVHYLSEKGLEETPYLSAPVQGVGNGGWSLGLPL